MLMLFCGLLLLHVLYMRSVLFHVMPQMAIRMTMIKMTHHPSSLSQALNPMSFVFVPFSFSPTIFVCVL
jgi:hypothetical protein